MQVKDVIKQLQRYYHPDDEIIIDWADMEQFNEDGEMTEEIWFATIEEATRGDNVFFDTDWIQHLVCTAQNDLQSKSKEDI
jgi:hypothetical protein